MNRNRLLKTLERHEGFRSKPYKCTADKLTIGIGRNIEDVGIRYSEAVFMLKNDVDECLDDLRTIFSDFDIHPDHIQETMINMRFQLGPNRFRGFRKMIAAVRRFDYALAADEMMDSAWYRQTPNRAAELIGVMRNGHKTEFE